jgi:DNA adenine methylase
MSVSSPLKWHGGKSYLASRIVALMPPHLHYVEPFAGGLSVLLAKDPEGVSEVSNDVNGKLTNFWRCVQCPRSFSHFAQAMACTPFCESIWAEATSRLERGCEMPDGICIACAAAFFVCCRQSLAGRMKSFAPLSRTRTRRGMNEQASAWINAVDGLSDVHERLRRVVVLSRDGLDVIREQDGPDTLFYCDPPYLHETREAPDAYAFEMTNGQHFELLYQLGRTKGKFLLSGYRSKMYDDAAKEYGWNRHDFSLPNNAAGGKEKRRMTESLWVNF